MIFNLNIQNKYISFQNAIFDFSRYGVYILTGANGIGKSTILRQFVFGESECVFNTPAQKQAYWAERHELITYIEQDPIPDGNSIKNYIYKGKDKINITLLNTLLRSFALSDINLNQSVNELSGGEFCKINIIAALLKNTPYIFMDEPTNNFDNEAVRELIQIISLFSNEHTFVIVSHDPRLLIPASTEICITPGVVTPLSESTMPKNVSEPTINPIPKGRLLFHHISKPSVVICSFFYLVLFIFAVLANSMLYFALRSFDSLPDIKNSILCYKVDKVFADLNKTYVNAENLNIEDSVKSKMLLFSDIPEIASMAGVEKIVFSDESYIYPISFDKNSDNIKLISIPHDIAMNFGNITSFDFDLRLLNIGRLPFDDADEVVLSETLLKKYGYSDYKQALGQQISIMNKTYTVVGCTYQNVCIVSYTSGDNFGYIEYDPCNYDSISHRISESLINMDATMTNGAFNTIIYTKEGMEKVVLNELMTKYPAENFYSYEFIRTFVEATNSKATIITAICNVIFVFGSCLAILLIFNKSAQLYKNELHALEIYYINQKMPYRIFLHARFLQVGILALFCLISTKLYLSTFQYIFPWLLMDYIALSIPMLFLYRKKNKPILRGN